MALPSEPTHSVQGETTESLLETADRCRRLAAWLTDRGTAERLLEMARECEERVDAIKRS